MTDNLVTVTDGITMLPNIVFTADAGRPLRLHLLRPDVPPGRLLPTIVWIFGGAFRMGSKDDQLPRLFPLVQRGYAAAAIDYRYSSEVLFPAQLHDCKCAIRFLRAHSADFTIDPDRIGAWGESSGGYLAAMLGITADVPELEGDRGWPDHSSRVQAICDWYGPTDFLRMNAAGSSMDHDAPDSPESELIGGPIQQYPERVARANPISYITPHRALPPFLVVHGDQDPLVPYNQSELLVAALEGVGANVRFHRVVRGGHGDAPFDTDEIRALVAQFFDASLQRR